MQLSERLDDVWQDVRYAARGLVRRPGFTITIALTLAVGIGATTSIFSAVNTLILRPLPFPRPNELMKLTLVVPDQPAFRGTDQMAWSYPKYVKFRDVQPAFSDLTLYSAVAITITGDDVERVRGESIDSHYLPILGVTIQRGRNFDAAEVAQPDAPRQVIISDALWKRRYNADPSIVGKTIEIDAEAFRVIGVLSAGFNGLSGSAELFVPITIASAQQLASSGSHSYSLLGRRKANVTVAQAQAATVLAGGQVSAAFPDRMATAGQWSAKAQPLDDARVAPIVERSLWILFCAVGLVLLVACLNIAGLLLGRASARGREMAVRLALGARRGRLVRLLITESLLLALIGAAASVFVALLGTRLLSAVNPTAALGVRGPEGLVVVSFDTIRFDGAALAFTLGAALVVGLIFGVVPAFFATRSSLAAVLKDDGRDGSRRRGLARMTARRGLVVIEIALALVLLVGSGLMIRSLANLLSVDLGFDGKNVITARLSVPPGTTTSDSLPAMYREITARLGALPGVTSASMTDCAPLAGRCSISTFILGDVLIPDPARLTPVGIHRVTPDWFSTMRVPLRQGRMFTDGDRINTPKVVIVNETAARRYWPNSSPIGQRVALGQGGMDSGTTVIGVVGDIRQRVDSLPIPEVYISYNQAPRSAALVFVRTENNPSSLGAAVRRTIHEIAPRYPVYDIQLMSSRTAVATTQARFSAVLLGLFAAVALSLAVIGTYGVMALTVEQRTREIGIRMALGADQSTVQRMVVVEGARLTIAGAILGLGGALMLTRVLSFLLFGVTPFDPATYATIVAIVSASALAASWIPARRATRVNPTDALRNG